MIPLLFEKGRPEEVFRWAEWRDEPFTYPGAVLIHDRLTRVAQATVIEETHHLEATVRIYEIPPKGDHPVYLIPVFFTRRSVAFSVSHDKEGAVYTYDSTLEMEKRIHEVLRDLEVAAGRFN